MIILIITVMMGPVREILLSAQVFKKDISERTELPSNEDILLTAPIQWDISELITFVILFPKSIKS
jgi:hypothetical protein